MSIYQELASRIHAGDSEIIPRLFEMLADETDAQILLALPAGIEELSDKFGISVKEAGDRIHELYLRGVVFPNKWTSPTTYRMAKDVLPLHDVSISVRAERPSQVQLVPQEQPVDWTWDDGYVHFTVPRVNGYQIVQLAGGARNK